MLTTYLLYIYLTGALVSGTTTTVICANYRDTGYTKECIGMGAAVGVAWPAIAIVHATDN